MGKIFKTKNLTTGFEAVLLIIALAIAGTALYHFAPGLRVEESKSMSAMKTSKEIIDNEFATDMLALPSRTLSTEVSNQPLVRLAGYAWNGQTAIIAANGGPKTTKGSLMEINNINLEVIRQDWLSELGTMQLKFVEEYNNGNPFPDSDKAAAGVMIMGDGAPFYISTRQKKLDDTYGKGKYNLQVVGCVGGMSNGEDKLIGPKAWKTNPQLMIGSVISVVPGDGDWVTALNHIFSNTLKVNPDFTTYDPDAVNFFPSESDDYMKSAEELIKSQTEGFAVNLKEIRDGKLTGNTVKRKIDGCATWTPGDQVVFDALDGFTDIASTKDFPNQMATTLIMVKEWAMENPDLVSNILKSALTAGNQIKQHDQWARHGAKAVATTFDIESGDYWYKMFRGQTGTKNGTSFNVGGTRALNYADVMQYYGLRDGRDRYKAVWNQVGDYLTGLNPFGFNEAVDGIVPYNKAVNLFFLKNINDIDAGVVEETDYSTNRTSVMASGEWHINFNIGSSIIKTTSNQDLETIYNLLVQAEQAKISLIGHTDNTGSDAVNLPLSSNRAQAVADYLVGRGISSQRIQSVRGEGSSNPIDNNSTGLGRANNRRVNIILFN